MSPERGLKLHLEEIKRAPHVSKTYCHSLSILSTSIFCGHFLSDPFSLRVIIYFLHITISPTVPPVCLFCVTALSILYT